MVTLAQLRSAGLSRRAIQHRVARGSLRALHRGVFAVGQAELTREGSFLAAVLALGAGAVLSHISAAVQWGYIELQAGPVDVTVTGAHRPRPGIRVHVVAHLPLDDTTLRHRIPITTPARTLVDLAADGLPERQLRRAVNQALIDRRTSLPQLRRQLDQHQRRPGTARLRRVLDQGVAPTRSFLEDELIPLLKTAGLPPFETNTKVLGFEVDVLFPARHLILEADGGRYHDNPIARRDDQTKQAVLEAAGYTVLRITWHQAVDQPAQTVERIVRALYRSGSAR